MSQPYALDYGQLQVDDVNSGPASLFLGAMRQAREMKLASQRQALEERRTTEQERHQRASEENYRRQVEIQARHAAVAEENSRRAAELQKYNLDKSREEAERQAQKHITQASVEAGDFLDQESPSYNPVLADRLGAQLGLQLRREEIAPPAPDPNASAPLTADEEAEYERRIVLARRADEDGEAASIQAERDRRSFAGNADAVGQFVAEADHMRAQADAPAYFEGPSGDRIMIAIGARRKAEERERDDAYRRITEMADRTEDPHQQEDLLNVAQMLKQGFITPEKAREQLNFYVQQRSLRERSELAAQNSNRRLQVMSPGAAAGLAMQRTNQVNAEIARRLKNFETPDKIQSYYKLRTELSGLQNSKNGILSAAAQNALATAMQKGVLSNQDLDRTVFNKGGVAVTLRSWISRQAGGDLSQQEKNLLAQAIEHALSNREGEIQVSRKALAEMVEPGSAWADGSAYVHSADKAYFGHMPRYRPLRGSRPPGGGSNKAASALKAAQGVR